MSRTSNDAAWAGDEFDPRAWLDAGFTAEQGRAWHRWRISPGDATAWRDAGVPEALQAVQWTVAGVRPHTVRRWQANSIAASEAVHWHELGVTLDEVLKYKQQGLNPHQVLPRRYASASVGFLGGTGPADAVRRFHERGVRPEIMHSYLQAHWLDEQAVAWAVEDVTAPDARLWQLLNVTPGEAGRLRRAGKVPAEVVREWWRAGIPYDEVADWLGAGLSAEEAAAQRAQGITAEQAATLRALREGEDPDD